MPIQRPEDHEFVEHLRAMSEALEPIALEAVRREMEIHPDFKVCKVLDRGIEIEYKGRRYSVAPMLLGLPVEK